jgi:hypothetical protein
MQLYDRKANKFRFVAGQSQSATLRGPAFYFRVGHSVRAIIPAQRRQARAVAMLLRPTLMKRLIRHQASLHAYPKHGPKIRMAT